MASNFFLFIIIVTALGFSVVSGQREPLDEYYWRKPEKFPKWFWAFDRHRIAERHVLMITDIIKDADNKMDIANRYVDMHKGSVNFELGYIAAGIRMRFRKMLRLYRRYSNMWNVRNEYYPVEYYVDRLHYMLSCYNMILYERRLFYKILHAHLDLKRQKERMKRTQGNAKNDLMKGLGKGKGKGLRVGLTSPMVIGTTPPTGTSLVTSKRKINKNTLSDAYLKRMMRREKFEERRAGFRPEVEGIEVDLSQMI